MITDTMKELKCAVLIPTYNNDRTITSVIDDVKLYCVDIIVVNDGSTDRTKQLLEQRSDVTLISYDINRGKGAALKMGLSRAAEMGFDYVITIDSDGQHYADDLPKFVEQIQKTPDALLIGARNLTAENMPGKNTFANKFSNFWFKVETWISLDDTQSGYRLYPLKRLKGMRFITPRYEFEVEVIVRAAWRGISVINIPIKVFYPEKEERVSHFRPFQDFTRISILNSLLVIVALLYYYPKCFFKAFNKRDITNFIRKHITHSKESNTKVSLSVSLGVFCGIIPIWGYQMITAGILAYFFKLNKVLSIAVSNISIPPMIPIILYGSLLTGGTILGRPTFTSLSDINFSTISESLFQYILGSVVLAIVSAIVIGLLTYILLTICKRTANE